MALRGAAGRRRYKIRMLPGQHIMHRICSTLNMSEERRGEVIWEQQKLQEEYFR